MEFALNGVLFKRGVIWPDFLQEQGFELHRDRGGVASSGGPIFFIQSKQTSSRFSILEPGYPLIPSPDKENNNTKHLFLTLDSGHRRRWVGISEGLCSAKWVLDQRSRDCACDNRQAGERGGPCPGIRPKRRFGRVSEGGRSRTSVSGRGGREPGGDPGEGGGAGNRAVPPPFPGRCPGQNASSFSSRSWGP